MSIISRNVFSKPIYFIFNLANILGIIMTKEKFLAYEQVRRSGYTNMFDVDKVIKFSKKRCSTKLTEEDCLDIMRNYASYKEQFLVK